MSKTAYSNIMMDMEILNGISDYLRRKNKNGKYDRYDDERNEH